MLAYLTGTTAYIDITVDPDCKCKGEIVAMGGCEFHSK